MNPAGQEQVARVDRSRDWQGLYRLLAIGAIAGFAAGFAAGLWTRIAMRVSGFLTSERNRHLLTEADAAVGEITFEGTFFLAMVSATVGLFGGVVYVAVRNWLPRSPLLRVAACGLLPLAIFGFILMDANNPDFQRFGPAWLNVPMFCLTFLIYGVLVHLVAERLDAWLPRLTLARATGWRGILSTLVLIPFGLLGALSVLPALFIAVSVGGEAAAIFAAMVLLYALARIVRRLAGDGGVMAPVLQRAGALSILIPGAVGFFLTVNGVVGIFAS